MRLGITSIEFTLRSGGVIIRNTKSTSQLGLSHYLFFRLNLSLGITARCLPITFVINEAWPIVGGPSSLIAEVKMRLVPGFSSTCRRHYALYIFA